MPGGSLRLMQYYGFMFRSSTPSSDLSKLGGQCIHVYARTQFEINARPLIIYGSIHVFNLIKYTHNLNEQAITDCIEAYISRNEFFLHSENILIAMFGGEDADIRDLAHSRILHTCSHARAHDDSRIRKFVIPKNIQFNAAKYYELIPYHGD